MVAKVDTALVMLWGHRVGAVSWREAREHAVFEFDRDFLNLGLDLSPIHMGLQEAREGDGIYTFPALNRETFRGLPGLLADALPDKFGNRIIDAWLARNGRDEKSFSPVERLCYTGRRGMGALEFLPPVTRQTETSVPIEIAELVTLAQQITTERGLLDVELNGVGREGEGGILDILRVGTSAGGARPKAVIAMNGAGKVRSGQVEAPAGYDYWLLKFDGVDDLELGKPKGYGRIEYAYYLMAKAAGVRMTECRLLEEGGRAHFLTRRFDRSRGKKQHMQSLCGVGHYDFNLPGEYGYEQAFAVMRRLRLSKAEAAQQFRRMLFNVVARNQDDHTKNIAFLMGEEGVWRLSPAFDVTYAHNPAGRWTHQHQMTINGKRDGFSMADLLAVGESISLPNISETVAEVVEAVKRWAEFASTAGMEKPTITAIAKQHRLTFP
ncbi:MAG: type II toxin-antitoxin system HipA family toxin [gamma proteobacterium endosymbiont of Lamellibrachia anaximandri]|nr:type II toxin-antitoxin system HipA family toxin [gamma proteobacterium endosymbiont of Lamellibrachia anaximandri]